MLINKRVIKGIEVTSLCQGKVLYYRGENFTQIVSFKPKLGGRVGIFLTKLGNTQRSRKRYFYKLDLGQVT